MGHRKLLYKLLFDASAATLLTFAKDQKHLGATPGIISVLHAWGHQLSFHPHIHCIVSGGGITGDNDWKNAINNNRSFFVSRQSNEHCLQSKIFTAIATNDY